MIAKFKVDNSKGNFWDKYFQPMPIEIMFPEKDEINQELQRAKKVFNEKYFR